MIEKLNPDQLARLDLAARASVGCEHETGCPAELTICQWALESYWGKDSPRNNCFGIKALKDESPAQVLLTTEYLSDGKPHSVYARFAVFDTLQQCFERHAKLVTTDINYRAAFVQFETDHDLMKYMGAVAKKYATSPVYFQKLQEKLSNPALTTALQKARTSAVLQPVT